MQATEPSSSGNVQTTTLERRLIKNIDKLIKARVKKLRLNTGSLTINIPGKQEINLGDEWINPNIKEILAVAENRIPILLFGGSGSGKTTLASQIARLLDLPFYTATVTAGMDESALLGGLNPLPSGGFEYTTTPFLNAVEKGGVMLIDEFDAMDENAALAINNIMEFGELDLPMRSAKPKLIAHKDFVLIACANTNLTGATLIHSGRNQLDGATISRFDGGMFNIAYSPQLETKLCPNERVRTCFWRVRNVVERAQMNREISTRTLKRAQQLWNTGQWPTIKALVLHFIKTWNEEEQEEIEELMQKDETGKFDMTVEEDRKLCEAKKQEAAEEQAAAQEQADSEKGNPIDGEESDTGDKSEAKEASDEEMHGEVKEESDEEVRRGEVKRAEHVHEQLEGTKPSHGEEEGGVVYL